MENLDTSIANQNILDESFSNISAGLANPALMNTPMRPNSGSTVLQVRQTEFKKPTSDLVAPSVKSDTSESVSQPSQSTPSTVQSQPIIFGGGGGGYPSQESTESEATSRESSGEASGEKLIFGVKSQYVYGLAAIGVLAFVYFKFIKK